jgi:hypothetical protein
MTGSSRKTIARVAAGVVAVSGALATLGLSVLDSGPAGAMPAEAVPAPTAPGRPAPDIDQLLQVADYVSDDGSYVRVGDVAISAAPVVTRGPER